MMLSLLIIVIVITITLGVYYTKKKENQNASEEYNVENLKKRIDELDEDNVDIDTTTGKAKIIVPDEVDSDESSIKSTQKEECKEYIVNPNEKIEKTVIGSKEKEEVFVNNEIERIEDDPIKEKEYLLDLLKKKKDEE